MHVDMLAHGTSCVGGVLATAWNLSDQGIESWGGVSVADGEADSTAERSGWQNVQTTTRASLQLRLSHHDSRLTLQLVEAASCRI